MKLTYSVLFVDNETIMLDTLKRGLKNERYSCFFAENAMEALAIMSKENISVIVSDFNMPEIDGLVLLKRVKSLYPKVIRLMLSDYQEVETILGDMNRIGLYNFIPKPNKIDDRFKLMIDQAVNQYIYINNISEDTLLALASL